MVRSLSRIFFAAVLATTWIGCSGGSPTAPVRPTQADLSATVSADGMIRPMNYPIAALGLIGPSAIAFPPRNEPNAFFQDLTAQYRDVLRRPQTSPTYVDPEGENVWLTEYFRFSLNGCSHQEATSRTLAEIASGGTQPVCGQETPTFPPRNLPNEFQGQLENTYRDVLRRTRTLSYVDSEGANVWLAEYLRYRVSGCSHSGAESKVFTQIQGGGVQPDCAQSTSAPSPTPSPAPSPTPTPTPTPLPSGTCLAPSGAPSGATAVCNDNTFSSSQNRSGTCSSHGGVSCWICPGALCF